MGKEELFELTPEELRSGCDLTKFEFQTTDDISIQEAMIGQERALKAIDFGLNIKSEGFNLYISGMVGTGRNTSIIRAVEKIAQNEPAPEDICYLYNFQNKDEPKALKLPAGTGCRFKKDTEELIKELEQQIIKAFVSEEYERHKKSALNKYEEKKSVLQSEIEEFAKSKGLTIQQTLTGFMVAPIHKGRPILMKSPNLTWCFSLRNKPTATTLADAPIGVILPPSEVPISSPNKNSSGLAPNETATSFATGIIATI